MCRVSLEKHYSHVKDSPRPDKEGSALCGTLSAVQKWRRAGICSSLCDVRAVLSAVTKPRVRFLSSDHRSTDKTLRPAAEWLSPPRRRSHLRRTSDASRLTFAAGSRDSRENALTGSRPRPFPARLNKLLVLRDAAGMFKN